MGTAYLLVGFRTLNCASAATTGAELPGPLVLEFSQNDAVYQSQLARMWGSHVTSDRNMRWAADTASMKPAVPAYKALYEQFRTSILTGQLAAGSPLPPSRVLAAETRLSRNTVLAAFQRLEAEGYVAGRQGSGTYVAQILPEQLLRPAGGPVPSVSHSINTTGKLSVRGEALARTRRVPLPSVLGSKPRGTSFLIGLPALD